MKCFFFFFFFFFFFVGGGGGGGDGGEGGRVTLNVGNNNSEIYTKDLFHFWSSLRTNDFYIINYINLLNLS